ncbi:MAG TPA: SIS domain-containing protein, partial [Aggregatilineales bacterium]|nr:SIS domain-containing protein [Aggregatilineales bacterium]
LTAGQENSFAQTRSFTTLLLATLYLGALRGQRQDILDGLALLPNAADNVLMRYYELARRYATDSLLDRFYLLGSGPRYGLACELSLKMKEMSLSHSEPFHVLEFRHGPPSMLTPSTLIVGLISETNRSTEMAVLDDMRTRGAQILVIAESDREVSLESGVAEIARSPLYLLVGQMLAFEHALHRQLDPDRPNNLDAVVRLRRPDSTAETRT